MWFAAVIGGFMAMSGFFMHRELEGEYIPSFIDTRFLRLWHNNLSTVFGLALWGMILTGLVMWGVPKYMAKKRQFDNQQ